MKLESATRPESPATIAIPAPAVPDPYLHVGPDRIYNPLTDRTLLAGQSGYAELRALVAGERPLASLSSELVAGFEDDGWLVDPGADLDARFYLKYVSLEGHTVCNQACFFCPVSVAPRESHFMPQETYQRILEQLARHRDTIEAVSMINYNEPTIDPLFVERVGMIKAHGLPPAVLSNGSGLTAEKVDAIVELGGLHFFSVNLSTLDREQYRATRGKDHLKVVLRNLDYAAGKRFAETMDMVVLGTGDDEHQRQYEAIRKRYGKSHFEVKYFVVNDRAGYLPVGLKVAGQKRRLAGCELVGSRPLQHLHITPHAKVVFCCQDYDGHHVVGDLEQQTLEQILVGPALKLLRRWAYGRDEAPGDFICRNCEFALTHG